MCNEQFSDFKTGFTGPRYSLSEKEHVMVFKCPKYQCEHELLGKLGSRHSRAEAHLDDRGPKGVRKQETPLCLRFRKACSTSLASEAGSIRQKEPFPGSSWERGTLMK